MANVLIVEDDLDLADAIADVVKSEGHAVRMASDGRVGLQKVYERLPDLILLDVEMPVLDGPAMVRRLPAPYREAVPIVLVSGQQGLETIAATLGTPYFLAKPLAIETLVQIVATALGSRTPG